MLTNTGNIYIIIEAILMSLKQPPFHPRLRLSVRNQLMFVSFLDSSKFPRHSDSAAGFRIIRGKFETWIERKVPRLSNGRLSVWLESHGRKYSYEISFDFPYSREITTDFLRNFLFLKLFCFSSSTCIQYPFPSFKLFSLISGIKIFQSLNQFVNKIAWKVKYSPLFSKL